MLDTSRLLGSTPTLAANLRAALLADPAVMALDNPALTAMCAALAVTIVGHLVSTLIIEGTYVVADGATLPAGKIVCRDAAGKAMPPAAGLPAIGVASADFDDSAPATVRYGVQWLKFTGAAPKPGNKVYLHDDETVTAAAGSLGVAGACVAPPVDMGGGTPRVGVLMGPEVVAFLTE